MKEEIDRLREITRQVAREGRLTELSRMPGAPPRRTLTRFNAGADPSGRTLISIESALELLRAEDEKGVN